MDYEKKYNDMVKRARELHEAGNALTKKQMEIVCPELTESEDERIRKAILGLAHLDGIEPILTKCSVTRSDILSYLEKQKEFVSEDFDSIWETEDCEALLAEGGKLSPRFKEMFKEVCHSWYDKGIEVGLKQKEPEYETYKIEREIWVESAISNTFPEQDGDFISEEDYREVLRKTADNFYEMGRKQKEQKPWKVGENAYFTPEQKPVEELYDKECLEKNLEEIESKTVKEIRQGLREGYGFFIFGDSHWAILEVDKAKRDIQPKSVEWNDMDMKEARENLITCCRDWEKGEPTTLLPIVAKRARHFLENTKPVELSEKDEVMLNTAIEALRVNGCETLGDFFEERLKSLRPQPKQYSFIATNEEIAIAKKDAYNEALDKIEYSSGEPTFDDGWCAAIKFIRQKNWKPSEELIDCLERVIAFQNPDPEDIEGCKSLLKQLKKL